MTKYEYKVIHFKTGSFIVKEKKVEEKFAEQLNELGSDGWELVSMYSVSMTELTIAVFKRVVNE